MRPPPALPCCLRRSTAALDASDRASAETRHAAGAAGGLLGSSLSADFDGGRLSLRFDCPVHQNQLPFDPNVFDLV